MRRKFINLNLYNFIILFGSGIIVIAFFVALAFIKKEKPPYFKYIFTFIILGLLVSTNTILNNLDIWIYNKKIPIVIQDSIIFSQSVMLGLFFIEVLSKSAFAKKIRWLLFLSILIQVSLIIIFLLTNIRIRPPVASNLFLLIFCFFILGI